MTKIIIANVIIAFWNINFYICDKKGDIYDKSEKKHKEWYDEYVISQKKMKWGKSE